MKRPDACPVCKGKRLLPDMRPGKWWCQDCVRFTIPPPDLSDILAGSFCDICGCTYLPGTHVRDPNSCQKPRPKQ